VTQPIVFALSVLALLLVPGPTNTLLAGAGATRGARRSLVLLIGELAGYNIAIAVMRATLGAVANGTSGAQTLLKFAVAAYLVFLAIQLWRAPLTGSGSAFTVRRVFVTTLLNPKGLIFALFIFPPPPTPIALHVLAFSAMVVAVGATWIVGGSLITRFTNSSFGIIAPRICACAMAAFAIVVVSGLLSH
jgi:threonine/homoserine/homoserine lactone efflux protein